MWFVFQNASGSQYVGQLPARSGYVTLTGPYSTRAKAQAHLSQSNSSGGGGNQTSTQQWWIIFTSQQTDLNTSGKVVESAGQPSHVGVWAIYGPYKDKATAQFALANSIYKQETPAWSKPGYSSKSPLVPQTGPLSGIAAIGNLANSLGNPHTWIRVGEVVLGLILIAVGVAKMTNAVPIATKIASVVK